MSEGQKPHNLISGAAVFVVADIHRSVEFYRDQLGFQIETIHGDPPSFAIADSPYASIMLKQAATEGNAGVPNNQLIGGLWDAYIWVRNLDLVMADLDRRKTLYSDPEGMPYGCTEIVVTDPDGFRICFGYCP